MLTQITVKAKVFFGLLVVTALGLFAADTVYTLTVQSVELAPQAGLPAERGLDALPAPRECDLKRGIDSACTFI